MRAPHDSQSSNNNTSDADEPEATQAPSVAHEEYETVDDDIPDPEAEGEITHLEQQHDANLDAYEESVNEFSRRWDGALQGPSDMSYGQWLDDPDRKCVPIFVKRAWDDLFSTHCWNHPDYSLAGFHLIIGQLPNMKGIKIHRPGGGYVDPRIHVFYIADSSSGKGKGSDLIGEMAESLGIRYLSEGSVTHNALVGAHNRNKNDEVEPGYLDQDGYEAAGKRPIGILELSEANMLLQAASAEHNSGILESLQKAMNVYGKGDNTVGRKTGIGERISYNTNVSLFMTTYKPGNLDVLLVDKGFFQRCLFAARSADVNQRRIDSKMRFKPRHPSFTAYVKIHCEPNIRKYFAECDDNAARIRNVTCHELAAKIFEEADDRLYDLIETTQPHIQEKLAPFIMRFGDTQLKIAAHFAIMKGSDKIEIDDATFAVEYINGTFRNTIRWLVDNMLPSKEFDIGYDRILSVIEQCFPALLQVHPFDSPKNVDQWVSRQGLVEAFAERFACDEEGAKAHIARYLHYGELQAAQHPKHGSVIRLTGDVRRWAYGVNRYTMRNPLKPPKSQQER